MIVKSEWIHGAGPPECGDITEAQVWMADGSTRIVKMVGAYSTSITPGLFVFAERGLHPMAQAILDTRKVAAWRAVDLAGPTPSR